MTTPLGRGSLQKNWEPTDHSTLCSSHFAPNSFKNSHDFGQRRFLMEDAVPTIFEFPFKRDKVTSARIFSIARDLKK